VGNLYADPPIAKMFVFWEEIPVEISIPPFTSCNGRYGHGFHSSVPFGFGLEYRLDLLQGKQIVVFVSQQGNDLGDHFLVRARKKASFARSQ